MSTPNAHECPISGATMSDPVICGDGHSYEREMIVAWLANHSTSPLTGLPLPNKSLTPNHALRNSIEEQTERQARPKFTEIDWDDVTLNKRDKSNRLGRGAFGVVWKASFQGTDIALKVIQDAEDEDAIKKMKQECKILSKLRHPNIITLMGATENDDGDFMLVMELAPEGNLRKVLETAVQSGAYSPDSGGPLGWMSFFHIVTKISGAVSYMHKHYKDSSITI